MKTDTFLVDTVPLVIWSCVELALINVAACIPTLRPLYLWLSGQNPHIPASSHPSHSMQYGSASGRFGRITNRSAKGTQLASDDDCDLNIYQMKTCDVTFNDREDDQSKSSRTGTGIGTTVDIRHGF